MGALRKILSLASVPPMVTEQSSLLVRFGYFRRRVLFLLGSSIRTRGKYCVGRASGPPQWRIL